MYNNNQINNSIPVEPNLNTTPFNKGPASNSVTIRGNQMTEYLPTKKRPSKNMAEASLGTLRFFRKVCRMMPFLLRIHNLQSRVNESSAMINVANTLKKKAHLRDPSSVDHHVYKGYEFLIQAEWQYCERQHLYKWLCPDNDFPKCHGYSFLENQKLQGKTTFLKGFYKGNRDY